MQQCPKCGYKEGIDWPGILWVISFFALYLLWVLGDYRPREYRWVGLGAFLLFNVGFAWMLIRGARNYREHRKLHPPITERVKDHIRTHED